MYRKKLKTKLIFRGVRVKTFSEDMERFLYWEDNTASFPLSAATDKQFTFLLAWGHVHSAIVQSPKGLSDPDREKPEKGGTHWATAIQKKKKKEQNAST